MSATDEIPEELLSPGTWNSRDWLWLLNFRKLLLLQMISCRNNKPISMQLLSAFPIHFHARLVTLANCNPSIAQVSIAQMRWLHGLGIRTSEPCCARCPAGGCWIACHRFLGTAMQAFDSAAGCRRSTAAAAPPSPQRTRCQIVAGACIHARSPLRRRIHPMIQPTVSFFFGNTLNVFSCLRGNWSLHS
jgi:hypothetical protein